VSAPLVRTVEQDVPACATAVSTDTVFGEPLWDATVTAVTFVPSAAITGAATNNRTVSLVNKGQTGVGTTVVATLTFASGTNGVANDELAVTLSGTPANLVVAAGDVLQWRSIANGTGLADPGGLARVTLSRN
jgi:hypothetical protein